MHSSRFIVCFFITLLGFSCTNKTEEPIAELKAEHQWPETFGLGRTATQKEIDSLNIEVGPDGIGLPPGSGLVNEGRMIYAAKCAACHGKNGKEGPEDILVAPYGDSNPFKYGEAVGIGNYWPYATTLYDYINRAMPFNAPGSLTSAEVYHLTAFLLYRNRLIDSTFVVRSDNLSSIGMPARKLFVDDDRQGGPGIQ